MNLFKKKEKTELQKQIDERISKLNNTKDDAEKDKEAIDNLEKLTKVQQEIEPRFAKINPNVIISGLVTLVGIGVTLKHEKLEVITSKAWSLIPKILNK